MNYGGEWVKKDLSVGLGELLDWPEEFCSGAATCYASESMCRNKS